METNLQIRAIEDALDLLLEKASALALDFTPDGRRGFYLLHGAIRSLLARYADAGRYRRPTYTVEYP